mgnify:FL=1
MPDDHFDRIAVFMLLAYDSGYVSALSRHVNPAALARKYHQANGRNWKTIF